MSLSVQHSVVESFSFKEKNVRSMHVPDAGQCLVAKDVSKAVGYNDDDNARGAVRTHVPGKYRMRLGDAKNVLRREVNIDLLHPDTVLSKEPGLYCFLLRCKRGSKISFSHRRKRCSTCIAQWWYARPWQSDSVHPIWEHCTYKEMYIRSSYKYVRKPSSILEHVM